MSEEVRRATLQRESYETRCLELQQASSDLKLELAKIIREQKQNKERLTYVETLEDKLAKLNGELLTLREENAQLLYLERLSVECRSLEPRLREVEQREQR